ncbi:MAG: phage portal protein, partial [candidate division KSB1 bacterium]|nr:phage portal protein [candidate division KSB1 bacterium]
GDPETLYRSFIRTVNGQAVTYSQEDVFYLKYVNPFNVLRGLSPLRAARSNLILQLNTLTFLKTFFKQGMSLGGVLSTEQGLDPATLERLKVQVQQQYGGIENMHKFLITWAGLKYQPLEKMSLTDADTLNLLGMTGDQIALIYGIPVEIIGSGRNTYENVRQATRNMWEQTLKPLAEKIAQQINLELIPELSRRDVVFKFDFSGVESLQQDKEAVSRVYRTGWDLNAITPNEYRLNVLKLDPLDFPEMDMPRFAIENARLQLIQGQGQEQGNRMQKVFKRELDGIWFKRMAEIDRHETTLRTKLQEFFIRQEQEVLKRVEELFGDQGSREGAAVEGKMGSVFDIDRWAAELRELGDPIITEIVTVAAQEWLESGEVIDLTHPSVRFALGERVRLFSILPNETTGRKIQQALREGFAAGDSIAGLKERIQRVFAEATDYRANLIARTEAVGATNFGTQSGLTQGKWQYKMWITSRDALVRDNHLIDGQVVPVDGVFTLVNGETRVFPNDFNERCIIIGAQTPDG